MAIRILMAGGGTVVALFAAAAVGRHLSAADIFDGGSSTSQLPSMATEEQSVLLTGSQSAPDRPGIGWRLLPICVLCWIAFEYIQRGRAMSAGSSHNGGGGENVRPASRDTYSDFLRALELIAAFGLYFASGPGVIILNKHIMVEFGFPYPIFVTNLGNMFLVVVTQSASALGLWRPSQKLAMDLLARVILPLSACTSLSLVLGNTAYLYISMPLVQILKSCALVLVMLFSFALGTESFNWSLVAAIGTIVAGCVLSVGFDVGADQSGSRWTVLVGLGLMLCANACEAGRTVFLQVSVERLPFADSLYWCSPAMAALSFALSLFFEARAMAEAPLTRSLALALLASAALGGCIQFSTAWITKLVGGLTMKVLVNARNIGLVLFSVMFLGETCSEMQYVGYTLALIGLAIYDRVRHRASLAAALARERGGEAGAASRKGASTGEQELADRLSSDKAPSARPCGASQEMSDRFSSDKAPSARHRA